MKLCGEKKVTKYTQKVNNCKRWKRLTAFFVIRYTCVSIVKR